MNNKGWRKDPRDERDYLYKRYGAVLTPDEVNLSAILPPAIYQDGMGACVGCAVRSNICATAKSLSAYQEDYSWMWNWALARLKEGTLSKNVGVYPRDMFDELLNNGCLYDQYWPFSGKFDPSEPSASQISKALKYSKFAYYRVTDGLNGILESLAESETNLKAGKPAWVICFGSPWPDKWGDPGNEGILPEITLDDFNAEIGHETILFGYDKANKYLYGMNSWGENWARKGCYSMPFQAIDLFKKKGGYDAMYLTFEAEAIPVKQSWLEIIWNFIMSLFKK
jgi:hypothetical protein